MEPKKDGEVYLTCPYDPSHRILNYRFQMHLVKCKKNNNRQLRVLRCCYNTTHIILERLYVQHIDNCKDRILLDSYVYKQHTEKDEKSHNNTAIVNIHVNTEASWDDDEEVPTYDPQQYLCTKKLLRRLDIGSAAVRRDFRMQERQRFQLLEDEPSQEIEKEEEEFKPLRRPYSQSESVIGKPSTVIQEEAETEKLAKQFNELKVDNALDDNDNVKPPPLYVILSRKKRLDAAINRDKMERKSMLQR